LPFFLKTLIFKNKKMSELKTVYNKLFKTELASQKVELALIDDIVKYRGQIADEYVRAQGLISNALQVVEPILKNNILKAEDNLEKISNVIKMTKELGLDVPKVIIESESISKNQISNAKNGLSQLAKINF
jgi:hypothetical protein